MQGRMIVIEGIDGSGKSTLASNVCNWLGPNGIGARVQIFPSNDGPIGKLIRQSFVGEVQLSELSYLYLMAADAIDRDGSIRATLSRGEWVIVDRHTLFSGFVYQAESHPIEHIQRVYSTYDWLAPDHAFLVDLPVEVALGRQGSRNKPRDVVFEGANRQKTELRRQRYLEVFEKCDWPKTILDGTKSPQDLVTDVCKALGL